MAPAAPAGFGKRRRFVISFDHKSNQTTLSLKRDAEICMFCSTCDDGYFVLERAPELGREDKGVDIGAEARGELSWSGRRLYVCHAAEQFWLTWC
jgi:hypothetical protein